MGGGGGGGEKREADGDGDGALYISREAEICFSEEDFF